MSSNAEIASKKFRTVHKYNERSVLHLNQNQYNHQFPQIHKVEAFLPFLLHPTAIAPSPFDNGDIYNVKAWCKILPQVTNMLLSV